MMKNLVKLSFVLFIISLIMMNAVSVYAALGVKVSMQPEKANENREIVINVRLSEIESDKGVVSLGGFLQYDKEHLTLVKMEGQNGWATPVAGGSYNESTGKLVTEKSGFAKSDETILKMTFKLKEGSTEAQVHLNEITISDSVDLVKLDNLTVNIKQTEPTPTQTPTPTPTPNPSQTPSPSQTPEPTESPEPTEPVNTPTPSLTPTQTPNNGENTATKPLPQTGEASTFIMIGVGILIVIVAIFYIKFRVMNKEIGKH